MKQLLRIDLKNFLIILPLIIHGLLLHVIRLRLYLFDFLKKYLELFICHIQKGFQCAFFIVHVKSCKSFSVISISVLLSKIQSPLTHKVCKELCSKQTSLYFGFQSPYKHIKNGNGDIDFEEDNLNCT